MKQQIRSAFISSILTIFTSALLLPAAVTAQSTVPDNGELYQTVDLADLGSGGEIYR